MGLFHAKRQQPELFEQQSLGPEPQESAHRPRIIVSLDRSWYYRVGVQYLTYYRLIRRHGGIPLRVDYGDGPEPQNIRPITRDFLQQADALLLSGGSDIDPQFYGMKIDTRVTNPRRDRFELALIEEAVERDLPILGICRGCQLLNVAAGGTLMSFRRNPDLTQRHSRWGTHCVQLQPDSRIARALNQSNIASVRSLHGMCVSRPGVRMQVVGWCGDVIEAIEFQADSSNHWQIGVQWHPELMWRFQQDRDLIADFIANA